MTDPNKVIGWNDEINYTPTPPSEAELTRYRDNLELMATRIKQVQSLPWDKFDNVDSAKIAEQLDFVHLLYRDQYEHPLLRIDGEQKRIKRPSHYLNNSFDSLSLFIGFVKLNQGKPDEDGNVKSTIMSTVKPISRACYAILDYLFGATTMYQDNLYLVTGKQIEPLSVGKIQERYKVSKKSEFSPSDILEILKFIHGYLKLKPAKALKNYVVACNDFQIDLKNRRIEHLAPQPTESYFKFYPVNYEECMTVALKYAEFLDEIHEDSGSLHNTQLQPIYTMLVACHLQPKLNFFIRKSGVRTGKGLTQSIISKPFLTKNVDLDSLTSGISDMGWATFDGGEMYLVTEAGDLTKKLETALKFLATEKTHRGRRQGGNSFDVDLSGVLSIDTNKPVLFSGEMNSRAVNIALKDRPHKETNDERTSLFAPFWDTFTVDKTATDTAGIASLLLSFKYWESKDFKINFEQVEFNNFNGDTFTFDEAQTFILEHITEYGKQPIFYKELPQIDDALKECYSRKPELRKNALEAIGLKQSVSTIYFNDGNRTKKNSIIISNNNRLQKAITALMEEKMENNKL